MENCDKKIYAKSLLTELSKFKFHQKYLDRDLLKFDLLAHSAQLSRLKMEQGINFPIHIKKIQYETQHLTNMVDDFKDRMINTASLFNYTTKKYREEIQLIDSELKKTDLKNLSELKQLKLECYQIEETTASLSGIIFAQTRPLTTLGLARRTSHLAYNELE